MDKSIGRWVWVGIMLLAGGLRLWALGQVPPSLDWDEVSMGYNAYSILQTGRDEFGKAWPLYFRALDDDKLPVYTYLTAGSIAVFGYNDWAVRFPSAFLGTATVLLVGIWVWLVFKDERLGLLAAGMMAISPWHLQFSRMASEVNVGLFWLILGMVLLVRRRSAWGVVSLGLSAYTYLSYRVVAPLMGLIYKQWLVVALIAVLIGEMWMRGGHVRFKGTSVFETRQAYDVLAQNQQEMANDAWHSRWLPAGLILAEGYLSHWSPQFLFFDFNQRQHQTPFVGLNYLFMLPLMVAGGYYLARGKSQGVKVMLMWLALAPLPAAVTRDVPHAGRTLAMVVPLMVLAAVGWRFGVERWGRWGRAVIMIVAGVSVLQYLHQYYIHLPIERSSTWQYGRQEMTEYLMTVKDQYQRIVVSTKLEWPYIFMLYYSRYDPAEYLAQGGTKSGGWGEQGNEYDRYEFHQFTQEDLHDPKALLTGTPDELIGRIDPVKVINYLDGKPAIVIGPGR
jgi:hypothetical protein